MNTPLRLAVYSTSPVMRTLLTSALAGEEMCAVVESGLLKNHGALRQPGSPATASAPDAEILLLDVDPGDPLSIEAARAFRQARQLPTLIVIPGLTPQLSVQLHSAGFTLVRARPAIQSLTSPGGRAPLVNLLLSLRNVSARATTTASPSAATSQEAVPVAPATSGAKRGSSNEGVLVIGASTGGPPAIRRVIDGLPREIRLPTVIVQHISPGFAEGFVRWLKDTTFRDVALAHSGSVLEANRILVAPSGLHTVVRKGFVQLEDGERREYQKPSVDVLFESAAETCREKVIAVLLTGMGRDGAAGCLRVKENGGVTIVQDEATSVVYGMPRAAVEAGAATEVLALDSIGTRVGQLFSQLERQRLQRP